MSATDESDDGRPRAGGYALVDWRLSRIEAQLAENAKAAVPIEIYNVNQQNIAAEFARLHQADADERSARSALENKIDNAQESAEKNKKQLRLTIAAGVLAFVTQLFVTPIARALGWG